MRMISRLRVDQNRIGVRGQIRIGGYSGYQSDKTDGINGENYSERLEQNSDIMIYKSFDNKINITVFKGNHPNDFNDMGSTKEIT
jgi:hypothetical protein